MAGKKLDGKVFGIQSFLYGSVILRNSLSYADMLYDHFSVDKAEYPLIFITYNHSGKNMFIYFAKAYTQNTNYITIPGDKLMVQKSSANADYDSAENMIKWIVANVSKTPTVNSQDRTAGNNSTSVEFTNFDCVVANPLYQFD